MALEQYKLEMRREPTSRMFWRDALSETVATFILVSVQAALPLHWDRAEVGEDWGATVMIAIGMGFVVTCTAWALGDFGGAHMNPAVTISMALCAKITIFRAVMYVMVQCVGAIAGAAFVYGMTPSHRHDSLAATTLSPELQPYQGVLVEAWITFTLVITIFGATNSRRKRDVFMPTIPIGFAVAFGIMCAIIHTGASMNPARSLGPAVVMGIWDKHWVYWVGPILGGVMATLVYHFLLDRVDRSQLPPDVTSFTCIAKEVEGESHVGSNSELGATVRYFACNPGECEK